jgi:hypothetical protein
VTVVSDNTGVIAFRVDRDRMAVRGQQFFRRAGVCRVRRLVTRSGCGESSATLQ